MTTPRNRSYVKGNVAAHIADCRAEMLGEIVNGDSFVFTAEDTRAWAEYVDTLTKNEMRMAFKQALAARWPLRLGAEPAAHLYAVEVRSKGEWSTRSIDVLANRRDQASRIARDHGFVVCSVNMIG